MMREFRFKMILACLMVSSAFMFLGCDPQQSKKMAVGRVDTAILLQDDPEYQSLSIEYLKEQTDVRQKFVEKMKAASSPQAKEEAQNVYEVSQRELDGRWLEKTQAFLQERHTVIQDTAEAIAKRKSIDMVIVDSSMYPTTEWGGVDITPDLQLEMNQRAASSPEKGQDD